MNTRNRFRVLRVTEDKEQMKQCALLKVVFAKVCSEKQNSIYSLIIIALVNPNVTVSSIMVVNPLLFISKSIFD